MSFSPVFHSDCKKCNSIWWLLIASLYLCIYLFGSLRASFLGGGGREGERGSTPKRACSQDIYLGELAMLEFIKIVGFTHHTVKYGPSISLKQLLVKTRLSTDAIRGRDIPFVFPD